MESSLGSKAWPMDLQAVPEASKPDKQALQKCHKASVKAHRGGWGKVNVCGKKAFSFPRRVMRTIMPTCSQQYSGTTVLFECLDSGLHADLLTPLALGAGSTGQSLHSHKECRIHRCVVTGTLAGARATCPVVLIVAFSLFPSSAG